ncbi:MAG: hypothetical protein ACK6DY_06850, partial [Acidobacteriota bacterium]|nr:hypothetical protein [Bryobacteraceae bacterium CoA2 C42]
LGPNPWDSVSNSQCTVWRGTPGDGTRATMAGRTVYLSLKVQFNANWRGGKTIYGALRAPGDISLSGWQAVGTWMQAPSGGNVMTSGLQLGGGAVQQLVMRYRTPFPDDLDRGQINLSGQVDNYQNACQMYWWPSRQLEVAGAGGSFEQGAGDPSICTVAAGTTLTPTVDGYEIAMKVRLSPQLLANFSSSNGDFYVATGATMKSRSGGQPIRTVNPTTPFDGDPDVPEDLFIYNDNQWYFFTGLCFGCNVIGNLNAGAGVSIRCTDPSGGARPPSPDVPREAACGSTILYPSEVQRIYVAMSAPNTTPAGWSAVFINAQQVGTGPAAVTFSRSIPLQIRAAAPSCTSAKIDLQSSGLSVSNTFSGYSSLVLNSVVQSPGGTYTWTSSNPAAFSVAGLSQGRGLSSVRVNVNAPGKATLKVAYRLDCGLYGEDSIDLVLTKDITVFGWINPDAITLPTGANPKLVDDLNTLSRCLATLLAWGDAGKNGGLPTPPPGFDPIFHVTADVDRRYANAFLVKNSGNSDPGSNITRWVIEAAFDVGGQGKFAHRAYNRFQAFFVVRGGRIQPNISKLQDRADAGYTPNPCLSRVAQLAQPIALSVQAPELDRLNGITGISAAGDFVYHINQSRVGATGQAGDTYLNDRTSNLTYGVPGNTTPWTWSVIQFDSSGNLRIPLTAQVFPTYYFFEDDTRIAVRPQSVLEPFISLSSSSRFIP